MANISNDVRTKTEYTFNAINTASKTNSSSNTTNVWSSQLDAHKNKIDGFIKSYADDYNMLEKDIIQFFELAFGNNIDDIYAMGTEEFSQKINVIAAALEFLSNKDNKGKAISTEEEIKRTSGLIKRMLANGNTLLETQNLINTLENQTLFEFLRGKNPNELRNYNSLNEIPDELLQKELKNLFMNIYTRKDKNGELHPERGMKFFREILDRSSDDEKIKVLNNFKAVFSDKKLSELFKEFGKKVYNKEKFHELTKNINYGEIFKAIEYNPEEADEIVLTILNNIPDEETAIKEQTERIINSIRFDIEQEKRILAIPENERTEDQKKFLKRIQYFKTNVLSASAVGINSKRHRGDALKLVLDTAKEENLYNDVLVQYSKIAEKYSELLSISQQELDKIMESFTNGEYTKVLDEYKSSENGKPSETGKNEKDATSSSGIGYEVNNNLTKFSIAEAQNSLSDKIKSYEDKNDATYDDKTNTRYTAEPHTGSKLHYWENVLLKGISFAKSKGLTTKIAAKFYEKSSCCKNYIENYLSTKNKDDCAVLLKSLNNDKITVFALKNKLIDNDNLKDLGLCKTTEDYMIEQSGITST